MIQILPMNDGGSSGKVYDGRSKERPRGTWHISEHLGKGAEADC